MYVDGLFEHKPYISSMDNVSVKHYITLASVILHASLMHDHTAGQTDNIQYSGSQ